MASYKATIGLEIHAELKTRTKMFCESKNDPDEENPNRNVCPVCMAHPGTLPVINKAAVHHVLRVGAAIGGKLADYSEFDRKNYFYPDLPKGYQISQFEFPLVAGGSLANIAITRIHLEEDTASSMHNEATGETLIDFNRAGLPLMELVTEPVIESAEQASTFARELQLLLRYLGASEAHMEKGQMRVEANVSVSETDTMGTKVEIKNLNSFRTMEKAVTYEIMRQAKLLDEGGTVIQETRGWDEAKQATFSQRAKEGSADYRYFPDPDLPSLKLSELNGFGVDEIRATLPELPSVRRARYAAAGIKEDDADLYVRDVVLGNFVDAVIAEYPKDTKRIQLASNYIANDLANLTVGTRDTQDSSFAKATKDKRDTDTRDTETKRQISISPAQFNTIVSLITDGKISSRGAKDLLVTVVSEGGEPEEIAKKKNLFQVSSASHLAPIVEKIIADNPVAVAEFRAGKVAAVQFLVGQAMKALRGAGDPVALRALLEEKLR